MRTTAKTMGILLTILISSMTVLGQRDLLFRNNLPHLAVSTHAAFDMSGKDNSRLTDDHFNEDLIRLNNWMVETGGWGAAESETSVGLEDWMLHTLSGDIIRLEELVKVDREEPLKLEKWMYCCQDWQIGRM